MTELPLVFNRVYGSFRIQNNELKTLEGSPAVIDGDFLANNNELESLKGGPVKVGGEYSVADNKLKSLDGYPEEVGSHFEISFNPKLIKLKKTDVSIKIGGKFVNRDPDNIVDFSSLEKKSFKNL
jgi:hypothetical protein